MPPMMKTVLRLALMLLFLPLVLGQAPREGGAGCTTAGTGGGGVQPVAFPDLQPPVMPSPLKTSVAAENIYVVKSGDSIPKIAAAHGVSTRALLELNQISYANKIRIGQKLVLPDYAKPSQSQPSAIFSAPAPAYVPQKIDLPPRTWPPENIAVADLNAFTLSEGEAKTLTEKLHTTLVQTGYFNILSRSEMQSVLDEQKFQRSDYCDDSTCLVEMGKILAVQEIVGGSIGKIGRTYSLTIRLVNVETGQTEYSADRELKDEPDRLLDLVVEAGRDLARQYALARAPPAAEEPPRDSAPAAKPVPKK